MKKTVKARWVAALRSGNYQQCENNLHQGGGMTPASGAGFCCLGVLCELAVADGAVSADYNPRSGIWAYGADTETGVLPPEVIAWAGLSGPDPSVTYPTGDEASDPDYPFVPLTTLNDDYKLTFPQIADLIETCL